MYFATVDLPLSELFNCFNIASCFVCLMPGWAMFLQRLLNFQIGWGACFIPWLTEMTRSLWYLLILPMKNVPNGFSPLLRWEYSKGGLQTYVDESYHVSLQIITSWIFSNIAMCLPSQPVRVNFHPLGTFGTKDILPSYIGQEELGYMQVTGHSHVHQRWSVGGILGTREKLNMNSGG